MKTEGPNLLLLTISVFWSSSRWPLATKISSRRQRSIPLGGSYIQVSLYQYWTRIALYWIIIMQRRYTVLHGPLARYVKLRVVHAPLMPGTFSPPPQSVITHLPWCMPGSLTITVSFEVGGGENVPGIPVACATRNFTYRIRSPSDDGVITCSRPNGIIAITLCVSINLSCQSVDAIYELNEMHHNKIIGVKQSYKWYQMVSSFIIRFKEI